MLLKFDSAQSKIGKQILINGTPISEIKSSFSDGLKNGGVISGVRSSINGLFISKDDIAAIRAYNDQIDACASSQTAFNRTMLNASPAAQNVVSAAGGAKVSMDSLSQSLANATVKTIGLKAASVALNTVLAVGISFAVSAIITKLSDLARAEEAAVEKSKDYARETKERADAASKEYNQISELIDKYSELATSDNINADTRSQILDIQKQIVALVGNETGNIDLVNGKYREQLAILQEIKREQLEEAIRTDIVAAEAATKSAKLTTGGYSHSFRNDFAYTGPRNDELAKVLRDAGINEGPGDGAYFENAWHGFMVFDGGANAKTKDQLEFLNDVIAAIELGLKDYPNRDEWKGLVSSRDKINTEYNSAKSLWDKTLMEILSVTKDDPSLKSINVSTAEGYQEYLDGIVDLVSNDVRLKTGFEEGYLDIENVESITNAYLGSLDVFVDGYEARMERISEIDKASKKNAIRETIFGSDDFLSTPGRQQADKLKAVNDWLDNLSEDNIDYVYSLAIDTANADKTVREWIATIPTIADEIPDAQKLSFDDIVNDKDFSKELSAYEKKVSGLKTVRENLINGKTTKDEAIMAYPELAAFRDGDMVEGVSQVLASEVETMSASMMELDNQVKDEDIPTWEAYRETLIDFADVSQKVSSKSIKDFMDDADFTKQIETAKSNIQTLSDSITKLRSGELTDDDIWSLEKLFPELIGKIDTTDIESSAKALWSQIYAIVGESADDAGNFDGSGMAKFFDDALKEADDATKSDLQELYSNFRDFFANIIDLQRNAKTEFNIADLVKPADELVSKIQSLQDVLDKITAGDFKQEDLRTLMVDFPGIFDGIDRDNIDEVTDAIIQFQSALQVDVSAAFDKMLENVGESNDELRQRIIDLREEYLESVDDIVTGNDKIARAFSDVLGGEIGKNIDDTKSKLSSIYDVIGKMNSDKLESSDITSLMKSVEEVADVDFSNLETAEEQLYSIASTMSTDVIKQLDDAIKDMTDEKDVQRLQNFRNNLVLFFTDLEKASTETFSVDTFNDKMQSYLDKIKALNTAAEQFHAGDLDNASMLNLFDSFPELAGHATDLSSAIDDLIASMDTDMMEYFNEMLETCDTQEARDQINALMTVYQKMRGELEDNSWVEVAGLKSFAAEKDSFEDLYSAISASASATGMSAEQVEKLKSRYKDLKSYDPSKLFESTERGIHLNASALKELEREYESITKADIDSTLDDLVDRYYNLTSAIENAGTAAEEIQLTKERDDVIRHIDEVSQLANQYLGLVSAFNKWQKALSTTNEGNSYDQVASYYEKAEELYKSGHTGIDDFIEYVQYFTNETLGNADQAVQKYQQIRSKIERYFDKDEHSSNGVLNFLNDLKDKGLASLSKSGQWSFDFGEGGDKEIAAKMGLSVEAFQDILRKLTEFNFNIDFDSFYTEATKIGMLQTSAEQAAFAVKRLRDLGETESTFNFDTMSIEDVDRQIREAQTILDRFRNTDGTINIAEEGAEEAQLILKLLINRKQELESPAIMKIDTSQANSEYASIITLLQQFQQANNDLKLKAAIGADTSTAQQSVNNLADQISQKDTSLLIRLGLDPTSLTPDGIEEQITKLNPEVALSLDSTLVDTYQEESHDGEGTVAMGVDSTEVDKYIKEKHNTDGEVRWFNNTKAIAQYINTRKEARDAYVVWQDDASWLTKQFKAWGYVTWVSTNTPRSSVSLANGTAYAGGTAFKNGNWGTKDSGVALGAELGQELVVRDGKYFTIGDHGAEFFKYERGDIIFNAAQTKELFEKGKVTSGGGRGKAFAEGTAFSSGSGTIKASGKTKTKASSKKKSTKSKSKTSSSRSTSSSDDKYEDYDWIAVAIERIEQTISDLGRVADSTFRTLSTRLAGATSEISAVEKEIDIQQSGYYRYMQQADSVSLSSDLKKKVREGKIDINSYSQETREQIELYKKWYDAAQDCTSAVAELNEKLGELYKSRFDNIQNDFDNRLLMLQHTTNTYSKQLDMLEERGYLGGQNFYKELIQTEYNNITLRKQEIESLTDALSVAVTSGTIKQYSEAWYNMQNQINEATDALNDAEIAVVKYNNALRQVEWDSFDYVQDRIAFIATESQFLFDLMGSSKLYEDNGLFSNTGMVQVGSTALNYDVYMAQADKYAEEIMKLNGQIASDPNNTKLVKRREELLKLQQQSISAAEDEKRAMADLVEEGINKQLESLQSLIDAYEDSLDSAKDLYNYQKKVQKQTKEISSLQKQLSAYQNDTSEENRARLQRLNVDLNDAIEELQETEYDQFISDQKKLLGDLYDDYEAIMNERLDNIDALMDEMIGVANLNSETIARTIREECEQVGYTITDKMAAIWPESKDAGTDTVTTYTPPSSIDLPSSTPSTVKQAISTISSYYDTVTSSTYNPTAVPSVDADINTTPQVTTPVPQETKQESTTPVTTDVTGSTAKTEDAKKYVKVVNGQWWLYSGGAKKDKTGSIVHTGEKYEYLGEDKASNGDKYTKIKYNGKTRWFNSSGAKKMGFSQGGFVADLQRLAFQNGDDMVTVNTLKKGEAVLTQGQSAMFSNLVQNLPKLQGLVDMSQYMSTLRKVDSVASTNIGDVKYETNVSIDHVEDYNDFVTKLQNDNQFEKMVQGMTIDLVNGGSRLSKHKYRW